MEKLGLLSSVVKAIAQEFNPLRIILFGSYARGEATDDSDLDLLVVLPRVDSKRQMAIEMRRALKNLSVPKDIIVTTPDEIELRGNLVGTVLRAALKEGRVVYERS